MATSIGAGQESEQGNRRVIGYPLRNWVVLEAGCYLALGARLRVSRRRLPLPAPRSLVSVGLARKSMAPKAAKPGTREEGQGGEGSGKATSNGALPGMRKEAEGGWKATSSEHFAGEAAHRRILELEKQVAVLQAVVAARDATILQQNRDLISLRNQIKPKTPASSDAVPMAIVAADVFLNHWCDLGCADYCDLVRVSLCSRTMHTKARDSLKLLRKLEFRCDLLWPLPAKERLEVVVKAVGDMGGSLDSLDLSALGRLSDKDSATLVSGLSCLKGGRLRELALPGVTPFESVTALLSTLTSLQRMDLSKNMMGDEGALQLASVLGLLRDLRYLDLGGKNTISDHACRALAGQFASLPSLEELLLPNTYMGEWESDSLAKALKDMSALQVLDLTGNTLFATSDGPEALGAALGGLHSLKTLRLGNTNMSAAGLKAMWLRGFMKTMPCDGHQLLRLEVHRNGFNTEGCKALAEVLQHLPQLQELNLSDNDINPDGMRSLAPMLTGSKIQLLNFAENNLGNQGIRVLAPVLSCCPELRMLDLTDNQITNGLEELVLSLPRTLCQLLLASNKIRNTGVTSIAKALYKWPSLKKLVLEENEISDDGIAVLAEHLKDNHSLVCLNLIHNNMSDTGCALLTASLRSIPLLQELLLGGNFIGESGCMAMASQLGTLSSLRELDLGSNRISKNACAVLSAIARKNKKLSVLRLEDQNEDDHVGEHDDDEPFYDPAGLLPNYFNIPNLYNVFGDGDGDSELDLDDNLDEDSGESDFMDASMESDDDWESGSVHGT